MTIKLDTLIISIAALLVCSIGLTAYFLNHHRKTPGSSQVQQFTQLSIKLKDGKPVSPPATYLVKPGIGLEFTIESDTYGKVGTPTDPPQTITFTQSPLVFHFSAPTKPGSYPLDYRADGSQDVVRLGTVVVKSGS